MKFGKVLCGVTAALTVLSSTAIIAQAEEAAELKLLVGNIDSLSNYYGDGLVFGGGKFYRIGDFDEWRKTGVLPYSEMGVDTYLDGFVQWSGSGEGGYLQLYKSDADKNVIARTVVFVDKENGKLKPIYSLPTSWCYTTPEGYTISYTENDEKNVTVILYDNTGKKTETKLTYSGEGANEFQIFTSNEINKYAGFVIWKTASKDLDTGFGDTRPGGDYILYGICKNGSLEAVSEVKNTFGYDPDDSGSNYASTINWDVWGINGKLCVTSLETGKTYTVGGVLKVGSDNYSINGISGSSVFGTKAIIELDGGSFYTLVDFNNEEEMTREAISRVYKFMSTSDGNIYVVQTTDDKWGYIDSNGNELAIFDDASSFIGDYAPVVKNGKSYFVDRNMNKVSEEIAAEGVSTVNNGLYLFTTNNGREFVTYANPEDKSDYTSSGNSTSESKPDNTSSSNTSSSSSSAVADGEDNPPTGAAMALIPIALVGGASAVVTRKRRK